MKRTILIFLIAVAFLSQAVHAADFQREIPKASWEPIFFESINQLTTKAGWTPLRAKPLPQGLVEIRIWIGFGLVPLKGFSLRREGSKWVGHSIADNLSSKLATVQTVSPKSGWDHFWNQLVTLDLLTLPDSSTLPNHAGVRDGVCYVVEINQEDRYRTYFYSNPQYQKWPEAEKIRQIAELFQNELSRK